MASPVRLRDSALSISSDSFVEQSGNLKVSVQASSPPSGPHCTRGGLRPCPELGPIRNPSDGKLWHRAPRNSGRGPQRVLSPAPPPPHRLRVLSARSRDSEKESTSPPQGSGNRASRSRRPRLAAPLDPACPGPAPNSPTPPRAGDVTKKAPKAWRAGLGPRSPTLPTSPRTGVGVLVGAGAAAAS